MSGGRAVAIMNRPTGGALPLGPETGACAVEFVQVSRTRRQDLP
jgi:hypothetical protein